MVNVVCSVTYAVNVKLVICICIAFRLRIEKVWASRMGELYQNFTRLCFLCVFLFWNQCCHCPRRQGGNCPAFRAVGIGCRKTGMPTCKLFNAKKPFNGSGV